MKRTKILRIFSIAVMLTLLVLAVPALPAFAENDIELDPEQGDVGDEIDIIGENFDDYVPDGDDEYFAEIYFAKDNANVNTSLTSYVDTYEWVAESDGPIDDDGYFETSFDVPSQMNDSTDDEAVDEDDYYVYVTIKRVDNASGDEFPSVIIRGKASFEVTGVGGEGTITLVPASGKAGTDVTINGVDFDASSSITFRFDSASLTRKSGSSATNTSGAFSSVVTVPSTASAGTHTIYAIVSGYTASATYTVTANAALDPLVPTTGKAGTDVIISGANFPASTALVFKIDSTTLTPKSGHTATTSGGLFLSTITIPTNATAGDHNITVTVGSSTVTATFTVTASAALNAPVPATGAAGTDVTVSGVNFLASYPIIFKFDANNLTPKAGAINTDTAGSFNSIITIPTSATAGDHVIHVTVGTIELTATFTVTGTPPPTTPPPSNAVLSINTSGDSIGSQIGIGGAGFTPGATVTFKYDNATVATATADASGLVTVIFKAPSSMHGEHTITVSDGTNSATTKYTVESEAPTAPPLILPEEGQKVESPITFDWTDVDDDSAPVTYDLQIAIDKDFDANSIVLEKTALEGSEFTYKESATLALETQEEPYYWRVRAVDAAFNQSAWSKTGEFQISPPFAFPKWALYLIIGVAALLLFIIGFWIGRRTAFYY